MVDAYQEFAIRGHVLDPIEDRPAYFFADRVHESMQSNARSSARGQPLRGRRYAHRLYHDLFEHAEMARYDYVVCEVSRARRIRRQRRFYAALAGGSASTE
jgi:predicted GNAT superfamily acetyltransferase